MAIIRGYIPHGGRAAKYGMPVQDISSASGCAAERRGIGNNLLEFRTLRTRENATRKRWTTDGRRWIENRCRRASYWRIPNMGSATRRARRYAFSLERSSHPEADFLTRKRNSISLSHLCRKFRRLPACLFSRKRSLELNHSLSFREELRVSRRGEKLPDDSKI